MTRVVVTGMGIISAAGKGCDENIESLRKGNSGIGKASFFKSKYTSNFCFGEVKHSTENLIAVSQLNINDAYTRTDALAFYAFIEAIRDSGLSNYEVAGCDTAIISASTVGGMCAHGEMLHDVKPESSPSVLINSYSFAAHTLKIVNHYHARGFSDTVNTACSSSANAIIAGCRLIESGRVKRAIVGGVDSLSKYTVNGFNSLRILSDEPCRPFDINRKGLSLGEGAAYLVLESEELAVNKKIYAIVSGFANVSDAFHQSSLSEDAKGVKLVMTKALQAAGLNPGQIQYINAHGTGTENNDKVELTGLSAVFGNIPFYNSTKSYTGHTLGAAGAIEAVYSIFGMINGEIFPGLNCSDPISDFGNTPEMKHLTGIEINNVLSNSFGFGGNCSSLIFSKL